MSKKNKKNQNDEAKAAQEEILNEENTEQQAQEQVTQEENTPEKKIAELEEQLEQEKKEYLFLMADFENFRKRTHKEKADLIKNGTESAMRELLPVVDDLETEGLLVVGKQHLDSACLTTVFEGVGEQVTDDLVKLTTVYPCLHLLCVGFENEVDMSLLGTELKHLTDAAHKGYQFCTLTVEMHLLLVNLTHVKDLVHQVEDTLGIAFYGL